MKSKKVKNKKDNLKYYISLKERIKKYKGKNLTKEYDWGKPVGKEIW